ncbi:hypothetical protein CDAR_544211 [Caerostris darwini]|uniref:Profilin n=1 Tax=Caerostris darwini TaxID=1538125 RepID=A0AAV4TGT5_9ARAC|nr:hypothetical protein CDAR_544211 [Caerostris darwini]
MQHFHWPYLSTAPMTSQEDLRFAGAKISKGITINRNVGFTVIEGNYFFVTTKMAKFTAGKTLPSSQPQKWITASDAVLRPMGPQGVICLKEASRKICLWSGVKGRYPEASNNTLSGY